MVRLVFPPYTQVRRVICTSTPLRTSTRVSSGFILLKHSSPSFRVPVCTLPKPTDRQLVPPTPKKKRENSATIQRAPTLRVPHTSNYFCTIKAQKKDESCWKN
ncbi:conserved hypothetical protein [Trichinella spiralis]|uniref:hypothetical protein n=1 Tax=Trichinella spiralis TaxID=6334 RepID=UPI0001EFDCDF|nr:conserved hypothetical protein [Trichinella spiralis]